MVKRALFPLEILPLTKVLYHLVNHLIAVGIAPAAADRLVGREDLVAPPLDGGRDRWPSRCSRWPRRSGLATAGVFFRDTRDILEVALPMLFWATPVFYSPQMAPPFLQAVIWANPLTTVHRRRADGRPRRPGAVGSPGRADGALGVHRALGSSLLVFMRYQPRFAEEL